MKTKAFLIATFFLAAGFYSCSNDNSETPNPGGEDNGTPTYMELSFSFPKNDTGTKASTGDENATLFEAALKTVDMYIFNSNSGTMVKYERLLASQFTQGPSSQDEDVWEAKKEISTTTGEKTVFVGVNLPKLFAEGLEHKSLTAFNDGVQSLDMNQLVTADGIAMFSAKGVTSKLKPKGDIDYNSNNVLKIPVKRLVAKVTVEEATGMTINAPGKIENLTFAINNINKKFYLVPKADGSDPNYQPGSYNATDFINAVNTPNLPGDEYIAVNKANNLSGKALNGLYTTENTSVNHWKEEITRATVRATFIPDNITKKSGNNYIQVPNPNTTPETFFSIILNNGYRYYFLDENDFNAYQADNSSNIFKVDKYVGGYCYYDIYLNKKGVFNKQEVASKKWDVFRNDYYRCRITTILAPGRSSEDPENPQTPPEVETDIKYEVDILFWNIITDDYALEP